MLALIDEARVHTITVMIMEVPCCMGLVRLAQQAAAQASRRVPIKLAVVGIRGQILHEDWLESKSSRPSEPLACRSRQILREDWLEAKGMDRLIAAVCPGFL